MRRNQFQVSWENIAECWISPLLAKIAYYLSICKPQSKIVKVTRTILPTKF